MQIQDFEKGSPEHPQHGKVWLIDCWLLPSMYKLPLLSLNHILSSKSHTLQVCFWCSILRQWTQLIPLINHLHGYCIKYINCCQYIYKNKYERYYMVLFFIYNNTLEHFKHKKSQSGTFCTNTSIKISIIKDFQKDAQTFTLIY